jgi:hypothetical protein
LTIDDAKLELQADRFHLVSGAVDDLPEVRAWTWPNSALAQAPT